MSVTQLFTHNDGKGKCHIVTYMYRKDEFQVLTDVLTAWEYMYQTGLVHSDMWGGGA